MLRFRARFGWWWCASHHYHCVTVFYCPSPTEDAGNSAQQMVDGDAGTEAQRRQGLVAELISKLADLAGLDQLRSKLFDELDTDGNGVLDQ